MWNWPANTHEDTSYCPLAFGVVVAWLYIFVKEQIGIPRWLRGREWCRRFRRHGFHPWVKKIPWRRKRPPTPVFLSGKSHGQERRSATVHGVIESWRQLREQAQGNLCPSFRGSCIRGPAWLSGLKVVGPYFPFTSGLCLRSWVSCPWVVRAPKGSLAALTSAPSRFHSFPISQAS